MPFYMTQLTLSPQGVKAFTANPQDRREWLERLAIVIDGRSSGQVLFKLPRPLG